MINPSIIIIHNILKHDINSRVRAREHRSVPSHVLADLPEDSFVRRLDGAGAKDLDTIDPHGGDPVVLLAAARGGEVEDDSRPWSGAVFRRRVLGGDWRRSDGVAEVVAEEGERARGSSVLRRERACYFKVCIGAVTSEERGFE